jgi:hypothetical protein
MCTVTWKIVSGVLLQGLGSVLGDGNKLKDNFNTFGSMLSGAAPLASWGSFQRRDA